MGQLDIFCNGSILVPLRLYWVGRGQNRRSCIQRTDDARLRNRQCLLFLRTKRINALDHNPKEYNHTAHLKEQVLF